MRNISGSGITVTGGSVINAKNIAVGDGARAGDDSNVPDGEKKTGGEKE